MSGEQCDSNDVYFDHCNCYAKRKYVTKWCAMPWSSKYIPCPQCDIVKLKEIPNNPTILYLDSTCSHCNKLEAAMKSRGVWESGVMSKHVHADDVHVDSPFPHTFRRDEDTLVQIMVGDEVVNMFTRMAGMTPDVEVNVNVVEPSTRAHKHIDHSEKRPVPSAPTIAENPPPSYEDVVRDKKSSSV